MKIKILGCSGGIGASRRTTSLLLQDEILIDSGTGVGDLDLVQMRKIRNVFITHTHMDHIAALPLMIDTIFEVLAQGAPLIVHGSKDTVKALREHVFNNVIWPDFSKIPTPEKPVMKFQIMEPYDLVNIGECAFEMIPVNHVVPTVAYRVESPKGSFAFCTDTKTCDSLWDDLNQRSSLDMLIIECAFPNRELELCNLAYHYCPSLLAEDLAKLKHQPNIYITHLKPGSEDETMQECRKIITDREIHQLFGDEVFQL